MTGTPTPDTQFVTSTQQQLLASQIYVTPQGQAQQTLATALGNGVETISISGVSANATLGVLPANAVIQWVMLRETAGHTVSVSLGTAAAGAQILAATSITASTLVSEQQAGLAEYWFSATAAQTVYIASASWGSGVINATVAYVVGP
jgi:hypothetical protein